MMKYWLYFYFYTHPLLKMRSWACFFYYVYFCPVLPSQSWYWTWLIKNSFASYAQEPYFLPHFNHIYLLNLIVHSKKRSPGFHATRLLLSCKLMRFAAHLLILKEEDVTLHNINYRICNKFAKSVPLTWMRHTCVYWIE